MNGFLTGYVQVMFICKREHAVPVRTFATFLAAVATLAVAGCGGGSSNKKGGDAASNGSSRPAQSKAAAKLGPPRLRFAHAGTLPNHVQLPAAAALPGRGALVMGGLDQADTSSGAIIRVDGSHARVAGQLPSPLHDAAAATIGSRTLFIGGGNAGATSSAIDLVSPGGVATKIGSLPVGSSDIQAATVGDAAYVIGGYDGARPLDTVVRIDASGHARVVAHIPEAVRYAAVTAVSGKILIAGGSVGTNATDAVFLFDPATQRVRRIARLPAGTTHASAAAIGSTAFVIGGRSASLTGQRATVVGIDPATGRVWRAGRLPVALSDTAAVATSSSVTVFGGKDPHGTVYDSILSGTLYRPRADPPPAKPATHAKAPDPPPGAPGARDVYAADRPNALSAVARHARAYVYVPNSRSNTVTVISQQTGRIVRQFAVGTLPQHVTPAWDLRTLYVTNDLGNSLTPIDPNTGRPRKPIPVTDPYNMYFTTDGSSAIVVEEAHRVLAFRDAHTMKLKHALSVSQCPGVDHMDFTADGTKALASCEFGGRMIVVDMLGERVVKTIDLSPLAMPQDVKLSPDGRTFYVADMASNGVWLVDAGSMRKIGLLPTGRGAHGLYPSRDSKTLFVSNRGEGSISLIDFATRKVRTKWHIPGGGSPDMGGLSADGRVLWLSGRYNSEVYAISTQDGHLVHRIPVGLGPHGLCVWPQPGRYSIGHTGILR